MILIGPIKSRESAKRSGFPLEITTSNLVIAGAVLRALLNLCRRPPIRFGMRRGGSGRFRDPQFASFLSAGNRRRSDTDFQDAVLKGRKVFKTLLALGAASGAAWIVVESAKALTVF